MENKQITPFDVYIELKNLEKTLQKKDLSAPENYQKIKK